MHNLRRMALTLLVVTGCGPVVSVDEPEAGGGSTGSAQMPPASSTTGAPTSASPPSQPTTSGDTGLPSPSEDSSDEGGGFLGPTSGCGGLEEGYLAHCGVPIPCDLLEQNCREGEACRPWANDGGNVWNARRCVPLDSEPGQAGDVCSVEGAEVSGLDTCDVGLMCWDVDPELLEGACARFCSVGPEGLGCADSNETCMVANDGELQLCLPMCDPLAPDCDEGSGCYPSSEQAFVCLREGVGVELDEVSHPQCPAGTFWTNAEAVEGCVDDEPCCTSYCHLDEPQTCGPGSACLPFFDPARPGLDLVGYCTVAN